MLASSVAAAVLWAVALAATIWILVPAIAFAFGAGGIRTEVLPDVGPPTQPGDEPGAQPVLAQLGELGFRAAGRTVQSGRFISPTHWSWRQLGTTLWLVAPDGRSYAALYRLVPGEPLRLSAITMFESGGFVRTSCPGGAKAAWRPHYWQMDLRGVSAESLIAKHQEQVEAFAREHGTGPRTATIRELTTASDAAELPIVRKMSAPGYVLVMAFAPALVFVAGAFGKLGGMRSSTAALGVCTMAGFYAVLRWVVHGPLLRYNARRSHTENVSGEPDDIAPDGKILATGKPERWLRSLALLAAVVTSAWPISLAAKLPRHAGNGAFVVLLQLALIAATGTLVLQLFGRARGKITFQRRGNRNPVHIWSSVLLFNFLFPSWLDWRSGALHRVLYVVAGISLILGVLGWKLEKKRGQ